MRVSFAAAVCTWGSSLVQACPLAAEPNDVASLSSSKTRNPSDSGVGAKYNYTYKHCEPGESLPMMQSATTRGYFC